MKEIEIGYSNEEVKARIKEVAEEISRDYAGEDIMLVGVLTGSLYFLTELSQNITLPQEIDTMKTSSYVGTESTGRILVTKDVDRPIRGRNVIVVEDIVDTGQTLHMVCAMLKKEGPKSLRVASLLDKPSRRVVDFKADYVGFEIPDKFVVGWGLDYNQKYRELPYIGFIKETEE